MNARHIGFGVLVLLAIALPFFGAYPVFVMQVLCFALFASAFNLLLGFAGLLSFGHAAFLGSAAYCTGYALRELGWPTEAGLLLGVVAAGALGFVIGSLAIRRSGIYFAMITLALAQMLYFIFLQAPFTHGEDGLQGIPRGHLLGVISLENDLALYYLVLAIFVGAYLLIERIVHSPFGQLLLAVRDNEARAVSLGYAADRIKLLAFVLSAALAGLAGALKALVLGFASLTDAHWSTSGLVILMVLVGGVGSLLGPLVGALIIVGLENKIGDIGAALAEMTGISWFSGLGEAVTIVTGLIFVVCVMAFRRGVIGEWTAWLQRRRGGLPS
ncbi:MAG TPA: branched-chain amino acid ABC transporter permease [Burkholderiaceae bacterium]|nr:branched-chain amino acid ABC transporter permease [Burkholderiaceae bacterium]